MNARKSLPDACFPTGFVPNVARIKAMDGTRRITIVTNLPVIALLIYEATR